MSSLRWTSLFGTATISGPPGPTYLLLRRQATHWDPESAPHRLVGAVRPCPCHAAGGRLAPDPVSTAKRRQVRGFRVVVFLWCCGCWPIPVACRIWRAKASCCPKTYRQKSQLAWTMVVDVVQQGLPIDYIVFDTLHTGGWLTNKFSRLGLTSVGVYPPAIDTSAGQRQSWLIISS